MTEDKRHERELKATLQQIKEFHQRRRPRWRLDVPLSRLAVEGIGVFVIGILVGLGLYVLYELITS